MKRGLIHWDRTELPTSAFDARLEGLNQLCATFDVAAIVAYSDVWRSNDVRFVSNYMPYWNRALAVVPRGEKPILLCSLSPRVYPWIKSVTVHETILASPSLPAQLTKLCAEKGWKRIGMVDALGLPNDLYTQLHSDTFALVDIPHSVFRPAVTESEIAMHRRGAVLAREILDAQLRRSASGLNDYQLAGRLEQGLRRAGAEDLVVLIANGRSVPLPAAGHRVGESTSATVAFEYNGHWVKVSRNAAGVTTSLPPAANLESRVESLSGRYPWEGISSAQSGGQMITAIQARIPQGSEYLYYGDTGFQGSAGWQPL
jgi:hypothetical protein